MNYALPLSFHQNLKSDCTDDKCVCLHSIHGYDLRQGGHYELDDGDTAVGDGFGA